MALAQLCVMTERAVPAASEATEATEATEPAEAAPSIPSGPVRVHNVAFTLLAAGLVIVLLQFMQPVLIPFVLAALLFYALDPAVDRMQKVHIPRAVGAALMLIIVVGGCALIAYALQGQALTVIDQLPAGARKLASSVRRTSGTTPGAIEKVQQAADTLQKTAGPDKPEPGVVRVQVEDKGFQASSFVWSSSIGLLSAANQLIMVLFLTYFMLLSDQLFKRKLVKIVGPNLSTKKVTVHILEDHLLHGNVHYYRPHPIRSQVWQFIGIGKGPA